MRESNMKSMGLLHLADLGDCFGGGGNVLVHTPRRAIGQTGDCNIICSIDQSPARRISRLSDQEFLTTIRVLLAVSAIRTQKHPFSSFNSGCGT